MSSSPSPRKIEGRPLAILVALVIGLVSPLVGMLAGWSGDVARLEFREPAPRPELSMDPDELAAFPAAMDAYLNDHFGFRTWLLSLNSRLHLAIGVSPARKFMVGREGWFFLRGDEHGELAIYRGTDRFRDDELERWIATMEQRQRSLEKEGIRFFIVIAPSKHEIYPEYLPGWANVVNPNGRYRQVVERVARGSSLELIDLHEPLKRAKAIHRVYHKTDGHWNELGAYHAYVAIVERLRRDFPGLPVRSFDSFVVDWATEPFGVITRRMNVADEKPEEVPHLRPRDGTHVVGRSWPDNMPTGEMDELYFTQVIDSDLANQPKLLLLRDSFSTDLSIFAPESFRQTVLLHHWFGRFREDEVLRFRPDIVVYEMLERGLAWELQ